MKSALSFAVYDSLVASLQESEQLINRASLYDRLSSILVRIDSSRLFANKPSDISHSRHGNLVHPSAQIKMSEVLELYWLTNVTKNFLAGPSDYLFIVNSIMWVPENPQLQSFLERVLSDLPATSDFASLYLPEFLRPKAENVDISEGVLSGKIIPHEPIAYLLTRSGAAKFIELGKIGFTSGIQKTFFDSKEFSTLMIQPDVENSMSVFSELFRSRQELKNQEEVFQGKDFMIRSLLPIEPVVNPAKGSQGFSSYASHWYATKESLWPILDAFTSMERSLHVLNTTDEPHPDFISFPKISFFDQFEFACQSFNGEAEFMLFFTADISSTDWNAVLQHSEVIISNDRVGAYCPALTFDLYNYGGTELLRSTRGDIVIAKYTDAICVFLHRAVVAELVDFFAYFRSHPNTFSVQVGWGMPILIAHAVELLGLLNIQDRGLIVRHPSSRSYSTEVAGIERDRILVIADEYFEMRRQKLHGSREHVPFDSVKAAVELDRISDALERKLGI